MTKEELVTRCRSAYMKKVIESLRNGQPMEIIVEGYSMLPTIQPGQKVTIFPYETSKIEPGNIIAFKLPINSWITVHRVAVTYSYKGEYQFKTRGDNMDDFDNYIVDETCFIGMVML